MGPLACCGCLRLGVLPWPLGCFPGLWAGLGPGGAAIGLPFFCCFAGPSSKGPSCETVPSPTPSAQAPFERTARGLCSCGCAWGGRRIRARAWVVNSPRVALCLSVSCPFAARGAPVPGCPPPSRLSSRLPAGRLGVCVCPACLCAMHLCLLVRLGVCVFPSRIPAVASCGRVGFFARWVTGRGRGGERTGEGVGVEGARAGCRSGAGTPRPRAVHSGGRGGVGAWCCCCFCSFRFSSAFASGSSRAVSFVWSFASCLSRLLRCVFSCPLSGAWCSPSHRRVGEGFLSLSLLLLFCAPRVRRIRVWARARPKRRAVRGVWGWPGPAA